MKEIEVLFELNEGIEEVKQKFPKVTWEKYLVVDTYFESTDHARLSPGEDGRLISSLRLREKQGIACLTYKDDHFGLNGDWLYSDEHEIEIPDKNTLEKIFKALGYKELVCVKNTKHLAKIGDYEIVLEEVENLGNFIEIEYKGEQEILLENVENKKNELRNFLIKQGVNFGKEMNAGKPELLLKNLTNISSKHKPSLN